MKTPASAAPPPSCADAPPAGAAAARRPALPPDGPQGRHPAVSRRRLARLAAALTAAGALAGCGGGLYLGYEWGGDWDDGPPRVSLSPLPSPVQGGGTLVLGAAASDADGVVRVEFWRFEAAGWLLLGSVSTPPTGSSTYQWTTVVPRDGRPSVSYLARAWDRTGRSGDSGVVSAAVVP